MQAVCWYGTQDIRVTTTPDPQIINSRDAIVQVRATTISDSDLHLYDGYVPTMKEGDIIGHEFMGQIVEIGKEVKNLHKGDRVVIPSVIACGHCCYCRHSLWSLCDNSNPSARMAEASYGFSPVGTYGSSYLYGGYSGSHA